MNPFKFVEMDSFYRVPEEMLIATADWEKSWNMTEAIGWMQQHWHYSLYSTFIYILVIFSLQDWMKGRKKLELRVPLIIWSGGLAIFSIMGCVRQYPDLKYSISEFGFDFSVCRVRTGMGGEAGLWGFLFAISKLVELGDTLFVALKKKPMPFLHWYHHVTVFVYCWYCFAYPSASIRWFCFMNYFVHSVMYTYYTLKAAHVYVPGFISRCVTVIQISQMFVGMAVISRAIYLYLQGYICDFDENGNILGTLMYLSYLILFVKFFCDAYLKPRKPAVKVD